MNPKFKTCMTILFLLSINKLLQIANIMGYIITTQATQYWSAGIFEHGLL
jgi:hypothetical protein